MNDSKKAVIYILISVITFSILNYLIKILSSNVNSYQILLFRSFPMLIICVFFIFKRKINVFKRKKSILVFRSIIGVLSLLFFYESIKYLDIGVAVSIRYISPVFAIFMAVLILKNNLNSLNIFTSITSIVAIVIISSFSANINLLGIFLALFSALLLSLSWVLISKIGSSVTPIVVVFYLSFFCTLIGMIFSFYYWETIEYNLVPKLLSLGILGYIAQLYLTKSFQIGNPKKIAPFRYFEILMTMILGVIFINESYSFVTIFGTFILIISLMIRLNKIKLDKNNDGKIDHKDLIYILKNRVMFLKKIFSNIFR